MFCVGAGVAGAGILLFRSDSDEVPVRLPAYDAAAGGAHAIDIVLDPQDSRIAYVLDDQGRVWKTTDAGSSFDPIPGTLSTYTTKLRTIELYTPTAAAGDDILLVGGVGGVYRWLDSGAGAGPVWTEFGRGLPNAIAVDLHYDPADDLLSVATIGRGVWSIANASSELGVPAALIITGDSDFINQPDEIELVLDRNNPLLLRASRMARSSLGRHCPSPAWNRSL
jgi:photosystem II stability/assembly factor-like uncharacterized protein